MRSSRSVMKEVFSGQLSAVSLPLAPEANNTED
jgi:hypothetical protein